MRISPLQGSGHFRRRFSWAFSPGYNISDLQPVPADGLKAHDVIAWVDAERRPRERNNPTIFPACKAGTRIEGRHALDDALDSPRARAVNPPSGDSAMMKINSVMIFGQKHLHVPENSPIRRSSARISLAVAPAEAGQRRNCHFVLCAFLWPSTVSGRARQPRNLSTCRLASRLLPSAP